MKRLILFVGVAALLGARLWAGSVADPLLIFSSTGPDTYADGTAVLPGECYALVFVPAGSTFAGVNADGTAIGDAKIVLVAPVAKRNAQGQGYCPGTLYQIDAAEYAALGAGSWGVYLLDTRVKNAQGETVLAGFASGKPVTVNAAAPVQTGLNPGETTSGATASASATGGTSMANVGVLARIDDPQITAIAPQGGQVKITLSGLSAAAQYYLVRAASPAGLNTAEKLDLKSQDNTVTVESAGNAQFFKIIGTRTFGTSEGGAQ